MRSLQAHCEASVGVVAGGDTVFGLVEQNVALALHCHYLFIVFHNVAVRNFGAEFGHYLAIDFHQTLLDKFIGFAAGADAGITHIFVEANLFVRIGNGHFIFHGLGAWSEAFAACRECTLLLVAALLAIVVSALTVVVASLAVVVVCSLMVVVSTLLAVVIATLTVVVVAVVLARLALALVAVLTRLVATLAVVVVSSLTVIVVSALLARLVGAGLVCRTLLLFAVFAGVCFGILKVGAQRTRLIGAWLVAALTRLIAAVVVVVALLIAVVVAALLSRLVGAFRTVLAIFGSLGPLIAGSLFGILAVGYAVSLPDTRAFRFFFVRIRFHRCLCWLITSRQRLEEKIV